MKNEMKSPKDWEPQRGSKAVIYCRVSSAAQVKKGDGLGSQETRCRQYAQNKGYEVIKVFKDEGASGGMVGRAGMQEMLQFLKSQKQDQYMVLIDDISRLARGLEAHLQLRTLISGVGAKLASPSIEFGEDSDSILVENLLASVSQHQRQKNAEQTKNRMKARVMNGYWCFNPPVGYQFARVPGHVGKMLVRDEPVASVVQEALEGYASGRFESQSEVKRFLDNSVHFPKDKNGEVHFQRVTTLLGKVLYAGYLDVSEWNVHCHPAKHEPLISFETYKAIQSRLGEQSNAPARKDLHEEFPLRGFVTCACCHKPMTACFSTGRNQKYPYYLCATKGCDEYRKSTRKEKMEGEFEELLQQLRPAPNLFYMASEMFKDLWEDRKRLVEKEAKSIKAELHKIDHKVDQLMERIVETDTSTVVAAYEKKLRNLEEEKVLFREKIDKCGRPLEPFEDSFRTAMTFLANPCYLWSSDRLEDKRTVLRLVFAQKLPYQRNEGFRTAKEEDFSLPFRLLGNLESGRYEMVRPAGFEPAATGLEGRCSIQLSYGRIL